MHANVKRGAGGVARLGVPGGLFVRIGLPPRHGHAGTGGARAAFVFPDEDRLTDGTRFQELVRLAIACREAAAMSDHKLHAGCPGGGNHCVCLRQCPGHGLFTQHVLAGLDRRQRLLRVQKLRRGNDHSLDFGVVQEHPVVGRPIGAKRLRDAFGDGCADVAHAAHPHQGAQALERRHVRARSDAAATDQADAQLHHGSTAGRSADRPA